MPRASDTLCLDCMRWKLHLLSKAYLEIMSLLPSILLWNFQVFLQVDYQNFKSLVNFFNRILYLSQPVDKNSSLNMMSEQDDITCIHKSIATDH